MSKTVTIVIALLVAAAAIIGIVIFNTREDTTTTPAPSATEQNPINQTTPPARSDEAESDATSIAIRDFAFSPSTVRVRAGTTVTWTNNDTMEHTVTPDDDGVLEGFGSELLGEGDTYSYTFSEAGTFSYHCQLHPEMTGTIEVVE